MESLFAYVKPSTVCAYLKIVSIFCTNIADFSTKTERALQTNKYFFALVQELEIKRLMEIAEHNFAFLASLAIEPSGTTTKSIKFFYICVVIDGDFSLE